MPSKRKRGAVAVTEKRTRLSSDHDDESQPGGSKVCFDQVMVGDGDGDGDGDGHANATPLLVFAHGAGASSSSPWMIRWSELLNAATNAVEVVTFDYPYLAGGKRGAPPKAEKLVDFHLAQVKKAASRHPGHPVVLVGKSMGSRVSCMVAANEQAGVAAVVCLGYPLKGANGVLRDSTLLDLSLPILFIQGSKDPMCPVDKLDHVRASMTGLNEVFIVEGGDHSFKVGKQVLKQREITQETLEKQASDVVGTFLERVLRKADC